MENLTEVYLESILLHNLLKRLSIHNSQLK